MCFNVSCYSGAYTAHSTEVKQTLYAAQNVILYREYVIQFLRWSREWHVTQEQPIRHKQAGKMLLFSLHALLFSTPYHSVATLTPVSNCKSLSISHPLQTNIFLIDLPFRAYFFRAPSNTHNFLIRLFETTEPQESGLIYAKK